MSDKALFQGFSEEKQKEYEVEVRERWGASADESITRWSKYSQDQKDAILAAGGAIMQGVYDNMDKGHEHPDVQKYIAAWHKHMGFFYTCSLEIFEGLGHMYVADPRFKENYEKMFGPGMAEFLEQAMTYYVAQQSGNEKS